MHIFLSSMKKRGGHFLFWVCLFLSLALFYKLAFLCFRVYCLNAGEEGMLSQCSFFPHLLVCHFPMFISLYLKYINLCICTISYVPPKFEVAFKTYNKKEK